MSASHRPPRPTLPHGALDQRLSHLSGAEAKPISELLVYVGLELRALCKAAYDVEAAVGVLITAPDAQPDGAAHGRLLRGEGLRGLQELDRLIQHMDGIADYLGALAEAAQDLGAVDPTAARKVLKLARLADGLAGRTPASGGGGGEVELL
ncbi:MAG: hypothetical protein EA355_10980 [Rhodobacteraceae bacterium]|nr:MAG: hypothetical protein EA355_10980 [Paracoccaceae bacterium]